MQRTLNLIKSVAYLLILAPALSAAMNSGDKQLEIELERFSSSVYFPYAEFVTWDPQMQKLYWKQIRQAWSEFEQSSREIMPLESEDAGVATAKPYWSNRFAWAFSALGILPEANAQSPKTCPVGGWERDVKVDRRGKLYCPTGGKSCGNLGNAGFECGTIYNYSCVSRFPLRSLTERCERAAGDKIPDRSLYEKAHAHLEKMSHRCQSGEYSERLRPNCDRLSSRLSQIRSTYGLQVARVQKAALVPEEPVLNRETQTDPSTVPLTCFPRQTNRTGNNLGGETTGFIKRGKSMKANGIGLEINGVCASSCTFLAALLPKEHVCVTSDAALAFHEAILVERSPWGQRATVDRKYMDRMYSRSDFSPHVRRLWFRHKHDSRNPTALKYARGRELQSIFPLCSEAKRRPACSMARSSRVRMASRATSVR